MANYIIDEDSVHYVAAFLDRWQEKAPTSRKHKEAMEEFRNLSNYLLEHLYSPTTVGIVRHKANSK